MATEPIEETSPDIKLHVSGSTVYAALKNLLRHHYGVTRESITSDILRASNYEEVIRTWLNGQHMRDFVSRIAREVVKQMCDTMVRDEVRKAVNGKIRISLEAE